MNENNQLISIIGPTAAGKTQLATAVAFELNGEIISADSRQVYKNMDIGTGKDLDDYIVFNKAIPYHLIDIHEPGYKYNLFEYQQDFIRVYEDICSRNVKPILCGGTGLYIDGVTKGYKLYKVPINNNLREKLAKYELPELENMLKEYGPLHNRSDLDTCKRAIRAIEIAEYQKNHQNERVEFSPIKSLFIGVAYERENQRNRISKRLKERLKEGMIEEVEALVKKGIPYEDLIYYGLEYKFIALYLMGELCYSEMESKLRTAIHQFAKRQMTWFRKMEKEGAKINWIQGEFEEAEKLELTMKLIDEHGFN